MPDEPGLTADLDAAETGAYGTPWGLMSASREVKVNVTGTVVTVEVHEGWSTLAPVTTAARWLAGCGSLPFDNFETRDDGGLLLAPHAGLGGWLDGRTLYVNRLAGADA